MSLRAAAAVAAALPLNHKTLFYFKHEPEISCDKPERGKENSFSSAPSYLLATEMGAFYELVCVCVCVLLTPFLFLREFQFHRMKVSTVLCVCVCRSCWKNKTMIIFINFKLSHHRVGCLRCVSLFISPRSEFASFDMRCIKILWALVKVLA
jgi:uncharacterized membrane protein